MMKLSRAALCTLAAVCLSPPALAALGGDAGSVEADRASMKGALRVTAGVAYSVHEIQTSGGTMIREYVSAQGKVFAVSWRGPGLPDLPQLLGGYSTTLAQAATRPHYNHHRLNLAAPDVIMESGGHLRTRFGRAWVPSLLPQNFSPKDIG
jgi:Protein of unknown function (DUF2844)